MLIFSLQVRSHCAETMKPETEDVELIIFHTVVEMGIFD